MAASKRTMLLPRSTRCSSGMASSTRSPVGCSDADRPVSSNFTHTGLAGSRPVADTCRAFCGVLGASGRRRVPLANSAAAALCTKVIRARRQS